jgi:hypothetical protein
MRGHSIFPVAQCAAFMLATAVCFAAPPPGNPGTPFQALADQHESLSNSIKEVQHDTLIVIQNTADIDLVYDQVNKLLAALRVQVRVDTTAANDQNDLPVRLFVLVTRNGKGLTDLAASAFTLHNPFYPESGPSSQRCTTCPASGFAEGGNGLYSILIEPSGDNNWAAGAYAGTVRVTTSAGGEGDGAGLVKFRVPVGPPSVD